MRGKKSEAVSLQCILSCQSVRTVLCPAPPGMWGHRQRTASTWSTASSQPVRMHIPQDDKDAGIPVAKQMERQVGLLQQNIQ